MKMLGQTLVRDVVELIHSTTGASLSRKTGELAREDCLSEIWIFGLPELGKIRSSRPRHRSRRS